MNPIRSAPLTVVLPAASREAIAAWTPYVARCPKGSQLLAVLDSPIDDPPQCARIVQHARPLGLGGCIQTAIWLLETPLALFVGSKEFRPEDAAPLFENIDQADLVSACRDAGPAPPMVMISDLTRMLMARVFLGYFPEPRAAWPGWGDWRRRWVARHFFGVPLHDPCGGLMLVRRDLFTRIPIQSKGSFAWVEIVAKANHLGKMMTDVKVARSAVASDSFAGDAWRLFRNPDFGPATF